MKIMIKQTVKFISKLFKPKPTTAEQIKRIIAISNKELKNENRH